MTRAILKISIFLTIIFFNIDFSNAAFYSSSVTTGNGTQTTTCTAPCCSGNGQCQLTTPQGCTATFGDFSYNYFANCTVGTCPQSALVVVSAGCTIVNTTTGILFLNIKDYQQHGLDIHIMGMQVNHISFFLMVNTMIL